MSLADARVFDTASLAVDNDSERVFVEEGIADEDALTTFGRTLVEGVDAV